MEGRAGDQHSTGMGHGGVMVCGSWAMVPASRATARVRASCRIYSGVGNRDGMQVEGCGERRARAVQVGVDRQAVQAGVGLLGCWGGGST